MGHTDFLFAANVVVWLGVGGYVAFLAFGQRRLARRYEQLELMRDGEEKNEL